MAIASRFAELLTAGTAASRRFDCTDCGATFERHCNGVRCPECHSQRTRKA